MVKTNIKDTRTEDITWRTPEIQAVKLNFDGALHGNPAQGKNRRNYKGDPLFVYTENIGEVTHNFAEVMVSPEGLTAEIELALGGP